MKDLMSAAAGLRDQIIPEAALFFGDVPLHPSHPPVPPATPRPDQSWADIENRFALVFAKPASLPPYRSVKHSCTLKEGCTVLPRAGVGRPSQEEITYTRKILSDYLLKGWIRPSTLAQPRGCYSSLNPTEVVVRWWIAGF